MSATGPMESPPQGEGIEASPALPSATNVGGGCGLGDHGGCFECSLGLDEQVKNLKHCLMCVYIDESAVIKAVTKRLKRLRTDPRGDCVWGVSALCVLSAVLKILPTSKRVDGAYFEACIDIFKECITANLHADDAWGEAAIERLRTDPRVDVQTLGLSMQPGAFWEGATALHVAVMAGDVRMVQKILEPDFVLDINGRVGSWKYTALHMAAVGGNVQIVDALIGKGADLMLVNGNMRTILHCAVMGGNEQMADRILDQCPSLLNVRDGKKKTPLHLAVIRIGGDRIVDQCPSLFIDGDRHDGSHVDILERVGVVKSLCQCPDIDVKALDEDGWSAFYMAVLIGLTVVVRELLECGKDKILLNEACDNHFGPPIQIAYDRRYKDIELALMERESVKGFVANLYRDRQVYVDSANAILVGAALIASVTFASWLQPPLNYTSYFVGVDPSAMLTPSSLSLAYVDVEHNVGLRIFWVFNALSFYFAMATVVCGAATVIPRTGLFIKDAVEKLATSLVWTSILLAFSVVFVIIAFAIAGSIVVTPLLKY